MLYYTYYPDNTRGKHLRSKMDDRDLNIPSKIDKKPIGNIENMSRVCEKMFAELGRSKLDDIARKSSSEICSSKIIKSSFFEDEVLIDLSSQKIYQFNDKDLEKKEYLDVFSSSMVLHYLTNADGSLLEGRWISYRELPDGLFYGQTIPGVLQPLVSRFENSLEEFINRAIKIGGRRADDFSNGVIIYPFRMFPVVLILDEKSEEFEANIRILFDSSAPHYIKTDVVKTITIYIVKKFIS